MSKSRINRYLPIAYEAVKNIKGLTFGLFECVQKNKIENNNENIKQKILDAAIAIKLTLNLFEEDPSKNKTPKNEGND